MSNVPKRAQPFSMTAPVGDRNSMQSVLGQCQKEFARVLPKHIKPDQIIRAALTAANGNHALFQCTNESVISSLMTASALGMDPSGVTDQAYLVPFKNQCTFMLGYRGMLTLIYQSGLVSSVNARAVFQGEEFRAEYGTVDKIHHIPSPDVDRDYDKLVCTYAVCKMKDGGVAFVICWKKDLDKLRAKGRGNFWRDYGVPMSLKTAVRHLYKMLPMSTDRMAVLGEQLHKEDEAITTSILDDMPPLEDREKQLMRELDEQAAREEEQA